jgi:hypothetical protein
MTKEYYYLLMSQQDLFQNEVIEEILRERNNSYNFQGKKNDFWILTGPKFITDLNFQNSLKKTNFYKQKQKDLLFYNEKLEFYSCIFSSNKEFITWLSLRLGYFEDISKLDEIKSANLNYISNGISGKLILKNEKQENLKNFQFDKNLIHPKLLLNKYEKLLEFFYSSK